MVIKHIKSKLIAWSIILSLIPMPVYAADMEVDENIQNVETVPSDNEPGEEENQEKDQEDNQEDLSVNIDNQEEEICKEEQPENDLKDQDVENNQDQEVDYEKFPSDMEAQEVESETEPQSKIYDLSALDREGKLKVDIPDLENKWIYAGSEVTPQVRKIMIEQEGEDPIVIDPEWYEISYFNHKKIGKATIKITGKTQKVIDGEEEKTIGCENEITREFDICMATPVLKTSSSYSAITVSWGAIPGAGVYKLYRSTNPNTGFSLIKTTTSTKYADSKTKINKTYYYQVVAFENASSQTSASSAVVSQKKKVAPATVKSAVLSTYTSVKVKWKSVKGADGYAVYYATSKNGKYKKASTVKGKYKTSYTVKKLKKGTRYYFMVRSYRKIKGKKCYSDLGQGKIMTIGTTKRMKFLFPKGTPKKQSDMEKYLVTISVPVRDTAGNTSTKYLRVHKALADDFRGAFEEMYRIGFPVRIEDTDTYNWRSMASSKNRSHHSYGVVVDINWNSNPMKGVTEGAYRPYVDPYSVTSKVVSIWKKYGFYWGGNWRSTKDYMHFTYTNH